MESKNFKFDSSKVYEDDYIEFEALPEGFETATYGSLFAYMYRRFGITEHESGTHDEIATWFITTPIETVALCVSPHPTGIEWSFRYAIESGVYNDNEFPEAVRLALIDAMKDLLVPVFVRDILINASGVVEPEIDNERWEEDEVYDEWEHAGLGVPVTFFENKIL